MTEQKQSRVGDVFRRIAEVGVERYAEAVLDSREGAKKIAAGLEEATDDPR